MKKILGILSFITLLSSTAFSVQLLSEVETYDYSSKEEAVKNLKSDQVKVYYFHATRRCATCQAVEEVSKAAVMENYGDEVSFISINREEESENSLVKKYEISGQTLLVVKGDVKVDLTNDAFLNARTNPDKLKSKIKSTIDSML